MKIVYETKFNIGDLVTFQSKKYNIKSISLTICEDKKINVYYGLQGRNGSLAESALKGLKYERDKI